MADPRKGGIFNSAKFSERVFKNLPDGVQRGVKRDLAFVTRRDSNANDDKWNKAALPGPSRTSAVDLINQRQIKRSVSPLASPPPMPSRNLRSNGNDVSSIVQAQVAAKAANLGKKRPFSTAREELENLRQAKQARHNTASIPSMFQSPPKPIVPKVSDELVYPMNRSAALMAKSILKGLPHLSLQNNDATMYESAVNKIIKDAIRSKLQKLPRSSNVGNPASQFLNQTAPLSLSHSRVLSLSEAPPIDDEEPSRDVTRHIQNNVSMAETTGDISATSFFDPFNQSTISVDSTLTRSILARSNPTQNNLIDQNASKFSWSNMQNAMNNSRANTTANESTMKAMSYSMNFNDTPSGLAANVTAASSSSIAVPVNSNDSFFNLPSNNVEQEDDDFLSLILDESPVMSAKYSRDANHTADDANDGDASDDSIFIFDD